MTKGERVEDLTISLSLQNLRISEYHPSSYSRSKIEAGPGTILSIYIYMPINIDQLKHIRHYGKRPIQLVSVCVRPSFNLTMEIKYLIYDRKIIRIDTEVLAT